MLRRNNASRQKLSVPTVGSSRLCTARSQPRTTSSTPLMKYQDQQHQKQPRPTTRALEAIITVVDIRILTSILVPTKGKTAHRRRNKLEVFAQLASRKLTRLIQRDQHGEAREHPQAKSHQDVLAYQVEFADFNLAIPPPDPVIWDQMGAIRTTK